MVRKEPSCLGSSATTPRRKLWVTFTRVASCPPANLVSRKSCGVASRPDDQNLGQSERSRFNLSEGGPYAADQSAARDSNGFEVPPPHERMCHDPEYPLALLDEEDASAAVGRLMNKGDERSRAKPASHS